MSSEVTESCRHRAKADLFAGPGEMRALCRRLDWAGSPLGPVEHWPEALQVAVGLAMAAPIPMCVLWGPQLVQIYNDAYRERVGSKHPGLLGRPTHEGWPELRELLGPIEEAVLQRGESFMLEDQRLVIERFGAPEEIFVTLIYSPLPAEPLSGTQDRPRVGGVLKTALETTARVRARAMEAEHARLLQTRQMQSARLLEEVFHHAPSFMHVLHGPDFVFEMANEAYYRLVGPRALIGRPAFEALPELAPLGLQERLAEVLSSGVPLAERELELRLARSPGALLEQRFVDLVYHPLVDPDGRRTRLLGLGTDVTDHVRQRLRTEAALANSRTRFQRLSEALEGLARAETRQELMSVLLDSARRLVSADSISVVMRHGEQCQHIVQDAPSAPLREAGCFPLLSSVSGWAMRHQETVVVPDVYKDARVQRELYEASLVKSLVMVPVSQAEPHAALGAYWFESREADAEEIAVLQALTRAAGAALDRHAAVERLRESEERFRVIVEGVAQSVWETTPQGVMADSPSWRAYTGQSLEEYMGYGWLNAVHPEDRSQVQQTLQVMLDSQGPANAEFRIRHHTGEWRWTHAHAAPLRDGKGAVQKWVGMNIDITERKRAEERARAAALHDPLTGLPNRRLVFEYADHLLAAAARKHSRGALLYIDLDRFKPINDLHGHEAGDLLLQEVSRRLLHSVRDEDLVGRIGGDEFVIVLPHLDDPRHAVQVACQVIDAVSAPFRLRDCDASISLSVGISLFPQHGIDLDTLMHAADLAMYHAKASGRGNYHLYTPELERQADESSSLEARLKRALQDNGLKLHYQPVIDMKSGRLSGVEALLRLQAEQDRSIGPDRFIPVAEAAGLIGPLGEWVAAEACRQHMAWLAEGLPPISVAINVSPLQFRQRAFAQRLSSIVNAFGIEPGQLQIEVTESTLMDSITEAVETLSALKSAGIRVALDDFGTGYSSLSHLSHLPLDKLKVDQSFVQRIEHDRASRAITEAIIALGRTLRLEVVGEGIDSPQALAYLHAQGCDQGQGYFFSRPLPEQEFARWYRAHPSVH